MTDGSVRFIGDAIPLDVFRALGTRAGGRRPGSLMWWQVLPPVPTLAGHGAGDALRRGTRSVRRRAHAERGHEKRGARNPEVGSSMETNWASVAEAVADDTLARHAEDVDRARALARGERGRAGRRPACSG